jgi:hypothetical protein
MEINLDPSEWRSERDKVREPKEPFFGPNARLFAMQMVVFVIIVCARRYLF